MPPEAEVVVPLVFEMKLKTRMSGRLCTLGYLSGHKDNDYIIRTTPRPMGDYGTLIVLVLFPPHPDPLVFLWGAPGYVLNTYWLLDVWIDGPDFSVWTYITERPFREQLSCTRLLHGDDGKQVRSSVKLIG